MMGVVWWGGGGWCDVMGVVGWWCVVEVYK